VATISHWGAEIEADPEWLLEEPAFGLLQRPLADAFVEVEKWDLRVQGAVLVQGGPMELELTVYADQSPKTHKTKIPCCSECRMPWEPGILHPYNGCPYGVIDQVMST
jgi:hypothetical protein